MQEETTRPGLRSSFSAFGLVQTSEHHIVISLTILFPQSTPHLQQGRGWRGNGGMVEKLRKYRTGRFVQGKRGTLVPVGDNAK